MAAAEHPRSQKVEYQPPIEGYDPAQKY